MWKEKGRTEEVNKPVVYGYDVLDVSPADVLHTTDVKYVELPLYLDNTPEELAEIESKVKHPLK